MKPRSRYRGLTLFVTVGSTKFDKLINKILTSESVEQLSTLGFNWLVLQTGESEYDQSQVSQLEEQFKVEIEIYKYKESIAEDIGKADLIIGHAGAGTCLEVLRMNKRLLVVVNDDLMDNHQKELADQLSEDNYVIKSTVDELHDSLNTVCDAATKLDSFPSKSSKFEEIFNEALRKVT